VFLQAKQSHNPHVERTVISPAAPGSAKSSPARGRGLPLSSRLKIRQMQTVLTVTSLAEELAAVAAQPALWQHNRRRGGLDRHFLESYIKAKIMAKG
jgi:hypothetical protein